VNPKIKAAKESFSEEGPMGEKSMESRRIPAPKAHHILRENPFNTESAAIEQRRAEEKIPQSEKII